MATQPGGRERKQRRETPMEILSKRLAEEKDPATIRQLTESLQLLGKQEDDALRRREKELELEERAAAARAVGNASHGTTQRTGQPATVPLHSDAVDDHHEATDPATNAPPMPIEDTATVPPTVPPTTVPPTAPPITAPPSGPTTVVDPPEATTTTGGGGGGGPSETFSDWLSSLTTAESDDDNYRYLQRTAVLQNMPAGYGKTQHIAAVRSFIAPTLGPDGKPILICDAPVDKADSQGALAPFVAAVRKMLQKVAEQEAKLNQSMAGVGAPQVPVRQITVNDVAGVFQDLLYNTTVDISGTRHLFTGYDPKNPTHRKNFGKIFEGVIRQKTDSMVLKHALSLDSAEGQALREKYCAELGLDLSAITPTPVSATIPAEHAMGDAILKAAAHAAEVREPEEMWRFEARQAHLHSTIIRSVDTQQKAGGPAFLEPVRVKKDASEADGGYVAVARRKVADRYVEGSREGICHHDKPSDAALTLDLRRATVADALAVHGWAHESGDKASGKGIQEKVSKAIRKKLAGMFKFIGITGEQQQIAEVDVQMQAHGVEFNAHLIELMEFMTKDTCIRVHNRYLRITQRIPAKRDPYDFGMGMGVDTRKAQSKIHQVIDRFHYAHGDAISEFRDRPDLMDDPETGSYYGNMLMAWHKGVDDNLIQKGSIFGIGNPQWKFNVLRLILNEMSMEFRELEGAQPNFGSDLEHGGETEFQRQLTLKMTRRMDNILTVDAQGRPLISDLGVDVGGRLQRDGEVDDMKVDGIESVLASTWAYTKRTWGKRDNRADASRIAGYGLYIDDLVKFLDLNGYELGKSFNVTSDLVGEGMDILHTINRTGPTQFTHIDQFGANDIDQASTAVADPLSTDMWLRRRAGDEQLRNAARAATDIRPDGEITHVTVQTLVDRKFLERFEGYSTAFVGTAPGMVAPADYNRCLAEFKKGWENGEVQKGMAKWAQAHGITHGFQDLVHGFQQNVVELEAVRQSAVSGSTITAQQLIQRATNQGVNLNQLSTSIVHEDYRVELGTGHEAAFAASYKDPKTGTATPLTTPDEVRAAMVNDLNHRCAYEKLQHDITRGTFIYMHTIYRKAQMKETADSDLRYRTGFRGRMADMTSYQLITNETFEASRSPPQAELAAAGDDRLFMIDQQVATEEQAERMRKYSLALSFVTGEEEFMLGGRTQRLSVPLSTQILCGEDWRKAASPDVVDTPATRMEAVQKMLKKLSSAQKSYIEMMVGEPTIDTTMLYHTLKHLEKRYVSREEHLLESAYGQASSVEFWRQKDGAGSFHYDGVFVTEAMKNSAPLGVPSTHEAMYGRMRMARLFGRYGDRLRALRRPLADQYSANDYDLLYDPGTAREREQMITEIATDLFGGGEFSCIGEALKEKAFMNFCQQQGFDAKVGDSPDVAAAKKAERDKVAEANKGANWAFGDQSARWAATQFYAFMQLVHSKYRGQGEQIQDSNTHGLEGARPNGLETMDLIDAMTKPDESGNIRIQVRNIDDETAESIAVSPRSLSPLQRTEVHGGFMVEQGEKGPEAHEIKSLEIQKNDPYLRFYHQHIGANQAASRDVESAHRQNRLRGLTPPALNTQLMTILDSAGVDPSHPAYVEVHTALAGGSVVAADLDLVRRELRQINEHAIRLTARDLDVPNPDTVDIKSFGQFLSHYGDALLRRADGDLEGSVKALNQALPLARSFYPESYISGPQRVDLRLATLNLRGWMKKEQYETTGRMLTVDKRRELVQSGLDDFTAAWHMSRGESTEDTLNPARHIVARITHWWKDRFTRVDRSLMMSPDEQVTDNAEAMSGIAIMSGFRSNESRVSGANRNTLLATGATGVAWGAGGGAAIGSIVPGAGTLAGAAVGTLVGGVAGAVEIGAVMFTERLRVSERWAARAHYAAEHQAVAAGKEYLHDYTERKVHYNKAHTFVNSADRSWFQFMRQVDYTWESGPARAIQDRYEVAARTLDKMTHDHIWHLHLTRPDASSDRWLIVQEAMPDTFMGRILKKRALESAGHYYAAELTQIDTPSETGGIGTGVYDALTPDAQRLARRLDRVNRAMAMRQGWWSGLNNVVGIIRGKYWPGSKEFHVSHQTDAFIRDVQANSGAARDAGSSLHILAAATLRRQAITTTGASAKQRYTERADEHAEDARDLLSGEFQQDEPIPKMEAIAMVGGNVVYEAKEGRSLNVAL